MEFSETPCLSAKKARRPPPRRRPLRRLPLRNARARPIALQALYIELMLQLACYLAMFVDEVKVGAPPPNRSQRAAPRNFRSSR